MDKITRAERSEQTRERIVQASRAILRKEGIQALTIARICSEASVSNGTFYHFFASKQAVISAVFPIENDLLQEKYTDCQKPEDVIQKYVSCYADYYAKIGPESFYQIVFAPFSDSIGNKTMYMEDRPIFRFLYKQLSHFQHINKICEDSDVRQLCTDLMICEIGLLYWACTTKQSHESFEKRAYSMLSHLLIPHLTDTEQQAFALHPYGNNRK